MKLVERLRSSNMLGWFVVFVGLVIILTPVLLPVCQGLLELVSGKQIPMRCHWTAQAEYILGGLVMLVGLLFAFAQQSETLRVLNVIVVVLGVFVILTPLFLIPTCMNPEMACNLGTKPALILSGGFTILLGLIGLRPKQLSSATA